MDRIKHLLPVGRPSFAMIATVLALALIACVGGHPLHAQQAVHSLHSWQLVGLAGTTLASNNPTLMDLAKVTDPDGGIAEIVEILNETNEILTDMSWVEGNLPTGHRTSIRTGLPQPTWRKLYGGVQPSKATSVQVTDTCGMLEAYGEVDKALADLNGNAMAFRATEDAAHIEGMSQQVARTLFYGNEASAPETFTGFAPRFSTVNQANAPSAFNVIDHGGTGTDNCSIWLVVWGPRTAHGIVPKASTAGLQARDLGETTIQNSDGSKFQAYLTHYRWDAGLTLRDWRYVVRVANVSAATLATLANTKDLVTSLTKAVEHIPNLGAGRPVFYMNRFARQSLRLGIIEKAITQVTMEQVAGKKVMFFDEVPVRRCDELLQTEARVV